MNRNLIVSAIVLGTLTACSGTSNKHAAGDFEYADVPEAKKVTVPEGLDTPKATNTYFVNDDINTAGPIGKNMDIRAPSLVLPIASGTRIENKNGVAIVWFDKVLENEALEPYILSVLTNFVNSKNVSLELVDEKNKIYRSDWFHNETESGMWLFESVEKSESIRFEYAFETKPHGRSVALSVKLIDYMMTDKSGSTKTMDLIDKERAEMAMLNEVVANVDYEYRKYQRDQRLERAQNKFVHLGTNIEDEPAYLVEIDKAVLWSNLPEFFEKYGFKVTDINEDKFVYFVDFVKPENSFWDSIWGEETPVINVDEAKYQFVLGEVGDKTSVTIYNADDKPLSEEVLTTILPVMEPGLSFKDIL